MAMGGGKKREGVVAANINVTPMIDVMLVLLIIFMIVTPAITAGFQAAIPRVLNPIKKEEQGGEIPLGHDKDRKVFLDGDGPDAENTGMRFISGADLQTRLAGLFAARSL